MYGRAEVTVRGILKKVQPERDSVCHNLAAAWEATALSVLNEGAARARETEPVAAHDSVLT